MLFEYSFYFLKDFLIVGRDLDGWVVDDGDFALVLDSSETGLLNCLSYRSVT